MYGRYCITRNYLKQFIFRLAIVSPDQSEDNCCKKVNFTFPIANPTYCTFYWPDHPYFDHVQRLYAHYEEYMRGLY